MLALYLFSNKVSVIFLNMFSKYRNDIICDRQKSRFPSSLEGGEINSL